MRCSSSFLPKLACACALLALTLAGCQPTAQPTVAFAAATIAPTATAAEITPTSDPPDATTDPAAVVQLTAALKTVVEAPGGWKASEEIKLFTPKTLFELMNGQSDAFFVYGFELAEVQRFTNPAGVTLNVAIFQVDMPTSAYGLFSANRDARSADVGNEGSTSPGQRLQFWQGRCLVQITALKPVADAELLAIAQGLSSALPSGGETPALITGLPKEGLAADPRPLFFHQELSIQDRVFLGGENLLGLGLDTDGVLAQYTISGAPVTLMLIEFPTTGRAQSGLAGLRAAQVSDMIGAQVQGRYLAAAFGEIDPASVDGLLLKALGR